MTIEEFTVAQLNGVVWNWEWVKYFPSVLCKQLLHQGEVYWAAGRAQLSCL